MLVLTGLNSIAPTPPAKRRRPRARVDALPDRRARRSERTLRVDAGMSMDQIARAGSLGSETQLASLELALESRDSAGACDTGYSCAYTNTIAGAAPTTPLPMENDPRVVFERLFGDSGTHRSARRGWRGCASSAASSTRSASEVAHAPAQSSAAATGRSSSDYLEASATSSGASRTPRSRAISELPLVDQPAGIPATFDDHANADVRPAGAGVSDAISRASSPSWSGASSAADLSARSACPTRITRSRTISSDPEKWRSSRRSTPYHMTLFSDFSREAAATPDGDGSLLDHVTMITAPACRQQPHSPSDLPMPGRRRRRDAAGGRHRCGSSARRSPTCT